MDTIKGSQHIIKSTDLRIGNLVYDNQKVYQIYSGSEIGNKHNDSHFQPIPLTEEWLVKFGGVKGQYVWRLNDMCLDQMQRSKEYFLSINEGEYIEGIPIKYVHSLQNLYFALTGEELNFADVK